MPRGNSPNDPFCRDGINFEGQGYSEDVEPGDAGHIDAKINNRGLRREYGIGDDQTPLDRPTIASDKRARKSSSDETWDWNEFPYGGPNKRQE